ncbi:hypothetical protein GWK41_00775 [Persephonella atlantica]|uniref:PpiC domain-containing protein n=1 Tax=Persephonella atlantica TaxID=2699429 RepID=A0ABS1GFE2_9AQUI|nr:SurA N-terminal domain-containing protein [Persephonella atlantica]MBK3331595.1 hypothetical protein [Persephonella atlantica]
MFINIGKSRWMKLILFITTFAFVGTAFVALIVYKLSGNIQGIAQVNGKDIPMAEFYYQMGLITRQMQSEGIDTAPLKQQIKAQALRNVIQQELLYQEAEREGIVATREEVKEYLLDIDAFKEKGHFSKDKYLAFLSQVNLTPAFFEEILRKELSIRHLLTIHRAGFYLTEDELGTYINKQLARITGEYILIKPSPYTPTEKEIQDYYQKHRKEFSGEKGKLIHIYQIDIKKLGQEKAEKEAQKLYRNLKENIPVSETEGVKRIFEGTVFEKNSRLDKKLLKETKKLTEDKKIALISEDGYYYIIHYIKEVSQPLPLEKVKEKIISSIKSEKEKQSIQKIHKEVNNILQTEKNLKNIAINYRSKINKINRETIQMLASQLGISMDKLSKLLKSGKINTFVTSSGVVVIKVSKVEPPDKNRKEEMAKLLMPILTQSKYQTLVQMLIDKLQEEADIKVNRRVIQ